MLEGYYRKNPVYKIVTKPDCVECDKAKRQMVIHSIDYEEVPHTDYKGSDFDFESVPMIWNEHNLYIGGYDDLKQYIYDTNYKNIAGYKEES